MSLRVWLPLDGDLRNLGCSNASLTNTNAAVNNSGKIGSCYSFGTSSSYLKFNDMNFMHSFTECSVSLWLKILSWNTSYATYFQLGLGSTPWAHYIFGLLRNSSASTLCFTISNGNSATNANCLTPALELNTWYHLTLTYTAGHCKIYVNGIETKDYNTTIVPNFSGITTGTIGAANNLTNYQTNCLINDFRIYDHCLSAAEVHEIAQGLILHYKLDDEYIESTTNYAPSPYNSSYNNASYAWDTTKHPGAIVPAGWSGGYNGGVSNPSAGYHAMWNLIDNIPTIVFQNHNSEISATNRWLGVSSTTLAILIPPTVKYTISYEQKTIDTLGGYTTCGIYYKYNSSSSTTFHDGCPKIGQNTKLNVWEKFSYTFTRNSNVDSTATNGTIYIYGHYGTESTMLVRNIQLELNDHATPYTISNRLSNNISITSNNLITGLTAGGRTTVANNVVTTAGTNADTYFYINLSSAMIKNHLYKLSCNVSGLPAGGYWNFPIASQSNTSIPTFYLRNGHNEVIFRANDTCVNAGTKVILDDSGATSRTVIMTANNFQLVDITPMIYDNSGFSNNGTVIGEFDINTSSSRYDKSLYLHSIDPTTNSEKGISYIQTSFSLTTPLQITITWWAKPESGYGNSANHAAFCTSNQTISPTDYNTTAFHHRDGGFDIYPSDNSGVKRLSFTYTLNQWHHYAVTYDGTTARAYQDGVLKSSIEVGANKTLASFSQLYIGFSKAGGVWRKTLGSYSDFRVYATTLSTEDILSLYHTGAKIDNKANIHTYEINENGANKLTKTGILYDNMIESIKVLPDGSYWQLLLFHYVDNGNNLFTSSNATNCNDFGLYSRLKDINNFTYNGKYEFYVIQDDIEYRWTQTNQPTASSVSGLTTVSGYANPVNGLAKASQSYTYIGYGTWWGACGAWTSYSTGGKTGIPGFGTHDVNGMCTRYLALYARIEKPDAKLSNQTANSFEFIEL